MDAIIDRMLQDYETGRISRRTLLGAIVSLAVSKRTASQQSPFRATTLNHVTVHVSDLEKSKDFYVRLLGLPVLHDYLDHTPPSSYLGLGKSFLCLETGESPGIDHFCLGLQSYDPKEASERLKANGLTPDIQQDQVYFRDPDGILVQLASADYNG
jgi:catechol 2,3-dioxygenase-like lactoylglutathione lyase family enzyme